MPRGRAVGRKKNSRSWRKGKRILSVGGYSIAKMEDLEKGSPSGKKEKEKVVTTGDPNYTFSKRPRKGGGLKKDRGRFFSQVRGP